ncbi:hypothetical protein IQ254_28900 [Nodosilinea sp. LEGE 07088]|uniref:hypothetical protein n=1 Tax=Nodosilinea sp. LEGE 07088 TaxID=2777968 RepID=UPI0018809E22|nr:hypothetical protein [Nodosilinea sp. LEGE 07088]MBE9141174.1 hypothetical protein [Nodosilinea sp. LEGE 07088]
MDLFSQPKPTVDPATLQQLKAQVADLLNLDSETTISINQIQCREPGCPPVETAIIILTQPIQQYKIHKAISDISTADLVKAVQEN